MAKADSSALKELLRIEKLDLLILDDFGIQPFNQQSLIMLIEMIEDRHGKKLTITASQLPMQLWFEIIGDKTIADAKLDRIMHSACREELKG